MRLFIYCAGGFGKEVYDTAKRINQAGRRWDEICFVDDNPKIGDSFYGARVFSFDRVLAEFDRPGLEMCVANGEPFICKQLYEKIMANGIRLATLVDPTAIVSDTAKIAEGVIVTALCSVASDAEIATGSSINTKSIVGHDIKVGRYCVISSLVNIGGASTIGDLSYLGMGVMIKELTKIGRETIVGMSSVVYADIPDEMIALGNPARPMRKNTDKRVFSRPARPPQPQP